MEENSLRLSEFVNPASQYRPVPFWGLTDELRDDVLREQIGEMADKGWGGFFLHPRFGLETPYLGEEYMARMRTCVEAAKEKGISAWIYDEFPFPAGCASGLSTACDRDYRHKVLVMRMHNRLTPIDEAEALGYFALRTDENGLPADVRPIADPKNDHGTERRFLHFYLWTAQLNQDLQPGFVDDYMIHGFPPSDNLNPKAVEKFIEVTYGAFRDAVGEEFGKTMLGGFSDIPSYNWCYSTPHPSIPWTKGFERYFAEKNGYDILPLLPSLFFDLGEYEKTRCDYWRTVNDLFVESCTKQLYEWCERNNLLYIAHYWGEETLHWQVQWCGDVMAHFPYHHYVGIDHYNRTVEDPIGVKQAASVAEQLGKVRTVSESYGMSGNSVTHRERKRVADWQYALGVNFLVPYIAESSFRGRRKRDEPSSLFIQQAYWQNERGLYDYFARLSYALTRGRRKVGILVMQPMSTAWAMYRPGTDSSQNHRPDPLAFEGAGARLYRYNQTWMDLCDSMLCMHRDFHIGNETILAQYGGVEGSRLCVGLCEYDAVVVPGSLTWTQSTVDMLGAFARNGGTLIAVEPLPTRIDGVLADGMLPQEAIRVPDSAAALAAALDAHVERDVLLADGGDICLQHRVDGARSIYFFSNSSMTKSYRDFEIALPGTGEVQLWDAMTGERCRLPSKTRGGRTVVRVDLFACGSCLLVQEAGPCEPLADFRPLPASFAKRVALGDGWGFRTAEPNVRVCDYCRVRIDDGVWSEALPVYKALLLVKEGGVGCRYALEYAFQIRSMPDALRMVVETPERFEIRINEKPLRQAGDGWWLDPAMRAFEVSGLLELGKNTVKLSGRLGIDTEVENIILLGDFCVDRDDDFALIAHRDAVRGIDVSQEGYPFFTGHMFLSKAFQVGSDAGRVFVGFDRIDATYCRVRVNGRLAQDLPWEPYLAEITDLVREGENLLEIELITTRYNLFGPFHDRRGDVNKFCAPHNWTNEMTWTDEYWFMSHGVTGARILYC